MEHTAEYVLRLAGLLDNTALNLKIRGCLESYAAMLAVTDVDVAAAIRTLLDDETRLFPDEQDIVIGAYRSKRVEAEWLTAGRDEARAEVERLEERFGNLCAVIFGDGGQRADELGSDAGTMAEAAVVAVFADVEGLRAEVKRLKEEVEGVTRREV